MTYTELLPNLLRDNLKDICPTRLVQTPYPKNYDVNSRFPPKQVLKGCRKKMINKEKQKKLQAKEVCYESLIFLANHRIQVFQKKGAKNES